MPVYNHAGYVRTAINSVLSQSYSDFELLVLDDGSTDGSRDVVTGYRDQRVRLVENERNLGQPATRNRGLELARGRYVAMLDSDDWAHPRRLEKQVAFLEAHPKVATLGSWSSFMDSEGRAMRGRNKKRASNPLHPARVAAQLLFRISVRHSSIMARTEVLRSHGYNPDYLVCQDYELHTRVMRSHRLANLRDRLVAVRVHSGQVTIRLNERKKALIQRIVAQQLDELGLAYTSEDLEYHYFLLSRKRHGGSRPCLDGEYMAWASDWLERIVSANRQTRCYDDRALKEICGLMWLKLQSRALRGGVIHWPPPAFARRLDGPRALHGVRWLLRDLGERYAFGDGAGERGIQ